MSHSIQDTIVALSTPRGEGAIGVIRLSGSNAISIVDQCFYGQNLTNSEANTVHYGKIKTEEGKVVDECLAAIFKAPRSYTKEDVVEISCHGSQYIIQEVMQLMVRSGARLAEPGEFTQRAFLNGQLDLAQAEGVADLIASNSASQHQLAMNQMRGGVSKVIQELRDKLIEFASLIELENDFSEEDVEFADRKDLAVLVTKIQGTITNLRDSFAHGNAIKDGVPVAIVGNPNVGKSTLLNTLLNENKAIVSEIAGTTRDVIEDTIQIEGILFRFIDTAGLRATEDVVEIMGIERTKEQIEKAQIVLYMAEIAEDYPSIIKEYTSVVSEDAKSIIILNKTDAFHACHSYDIEEAISTSLRRMPVIALSAKEGNHVDKLKQLLINQVKGMKGDANQVTISNLRHYESLVKSNESLQSVLNGLAMEIPSDLIAIDIRDALYHLGMISGEISTDDLLSSIFSNFCIGK